MNTEALTELKLSAARVRKMILEGTHAAKSGHPGGSLSSADILTYLYKKEMNVNPENAKDPNRDRFVLSKGHAAPLLYAVLAECGYIPKEDIKTLRKADSYLQGHPDMKGTNGVDMSTGSLGQGISAACGMALAAKIDKKDYRTYAILGDGESEEGQVWESAMFAAHYKLDNLCAFLDFNGLQIDGAISEVMNPTPFDKKFAAFGWNVIVIDGHNFEEIENALKSARETKGMPTVIIANTTKGKDISFMENQVSWHGASPNDEQYEIAVSDIDTIIESLGGAC